MLVYVRHTDVTHSSANYGPLLRLTTACCVAHSKANCYLNVGQYWLVTVQLRLKMTSLFVPVYGQCYFQK